MISYINTHTWYIQLCVSLRMVMNKPDSAADDIACNIECVT